MPTALRALWIAALLCAFAGPAQADSWVAPQVRDVFSASRDHFVRVIPGKSFGDTIGFASAAKGAYAAAEYYRRQPDRSYKLTATATLLNPVAPVDIFVSNEGRLATIDNWHNRGYGKVLALYDAAGRPVKTYALADLFAKAEIAAFPHSVSSIHWHNGPAYINQHALPDDCPRPRSGPRPRYRAVCAVRDAGGEISLQEWQCGSPVGALQRSPAGTLSGSRQPSTAAEESGEHYRDGGIYVPRGGNETH